MDLTVEQDFVVDEHNCQISARDVALVLISVAKGSQEIAVTARTQLTDTVDGDSLTIKVGEYNILFYCEDGDLSYVSKCIFGKRQSSYDDWITNPLDLMHEDMTEALSNEIINSQKDQWK